MRSVRGILIGFSLLIVSSAFAQIPMRADVQPLLARVDAGWITRFETRVDSLGDDVSLTTLRIQYQIDGGATIDRIEGDGWNCAIDGATADCAPSAQQPPLGTRLVVLVQTSNSNGAEATLTMKVTSTNPLIGSTLSRVTLQNYYAVIVNTTADAGPRSLRAAIEEANAVGKPAKILFEIPAPVPAEGWFTIIPESPLPPITVASMFVDGKSQTRLTGDTNPRGPEIAIDGHLAHYGLEIHSRCEAKVTGLVLGNFDANQGLWFTSSEFCGSVPHTIDYERWVTDNYIGTDPTGTVAWPNLRGLRADFGHGEVRNNVISGNIYSGMWCWTTSNSLLVENNRFGTAADGITPLPNGAAGMLFGPHATADVRRNVIANHPGMGIALVRGATFVDIRENSMRDNGGIGIDWGIDGVSPRIDHDGETHPNAPVLLSSRYDAPSNRTFFTLTANSELVLGPNAHLLRFDFYANRGSDGDGEQWLGTGDFPGDDERPFEVSIAGDYRGKWINATATRTPVFGLRAPRVDATYPGLGEGSTSELSNAVLVGN